MKRIFFLLHFAFIFVNIANAQNNYLYFVSNDSVASVTVANTSNSNLNLEYSYDSINWNRVLPRKSVPFSKLGDTIFFRGNNPDGLSSKNNYTSFSFEGKVSAYGNVISLLDGEGKLTKIPSDFCFSRLFADCATLQTPPHILADTLAEYCFAEMFSGCKSLIFTPEFRALQLPKGCYQRMFADCASLKTQFMINALKVSESSCKSMFYGCVSLKEVPDLLARRLESSSYESMYENCTSLLKAPKIEAEILSDHCCQAMFKNCVSLTVAPILKSKILANRCYRKMFQACTNLTKIAKNSASKLADYCYEDMYSDCPKIKVPKVYEMRNPINEDLIISLSGDCKCKGYGAYIFDGKILLGDFVEGVFVGNGSSYLGNEKYLVGDFYDSKANGLIIKLEKDGSVSKSVFSNGDEEQDFFSEGCVSGNCSNGFGVRIFKDGRHYVGNFKNSMYSGQGKLTTTSFYYQGEFLDGQYNGYGSLVLSDGTEFTGIFKNGEFVSELSKYPLIGCVSGDCVDGFGVELYRDKSYYIGDFRSGVREGYGRLIQKDCSYSGNWKDDKRDGWGEYVAKPSEKYAKYFGFFENDNFSKYGAFFYRDGSLVYGQINNHRIEGQAVRIADELKTTGAYFNGEFRKRGLDYADFDLISGRRDSFGIRLVDNGLYFGNLKSGLPNGAGILVGYDGFTIASDGFVDGKLIGYGVAEDRINGKTYMGSFFNNSVTGRGVMLFSDGLFLNGYFSNGEFVKPFYDSESPKPLVKISAPDLLSSESYYKNLRVKITINSKSTVDEIVIKQNGFPKIVSSLNLFGRVDESDEYVYEYTFPLEEGENSFTAEVRNAGGTTISDSFTVNYSENY